MAKRELFGTDGLRGRANVNPMTAEVCLDLGVALGTVCRTWREADGARPRVVIGRDTRVSGPLFESALAAGLMSVGVDAVRLGVLPTPAVALLTRELGAHAGLVISASHNPAEDNGVKVFGPDGFKRTDDEELALEAACLDARALPRASGAATGALLDEHRAGELYLHGLIAALPEPLDLSGLRIALDCADGAAHRVGPELFRRLGAHVLPLGDGGDGLRINDGLGALHPERVAALVSESGADLGVALDGDADRVILADETGAILDGDELLAIGAVAYHARGQLRGDAIAATVMSNIGLEVYLKARGIGLVRTAVGDRYVVEALRERGLVMGGEQSGHIVALDRATTGDGLAAALLILGEMRRRGGPLSALRQGFARFPQRLVNVAVAAKPPLEGLTDLQAAIADVEQALGDTGRVLIRYSGTELKARVMVEGPDAEAVDRFADTLAAALRRAVGGPP